MLGKWFKGRRQTPKRAAGFAKLLLVAAKNFTAIANDRPYRKASRTPPIDFEECHPNAATVLTGVRAREKPRLTACLSGVAMPGLSAVAVRQVRKRHKTAGHVGRQRFLEKLALPLG